MKPGGLDYKEHFKKLNYEIDKWIEDIERIFERWFNRLIKNKYPFVKDIADVRQVGTHYPDKEVSIAIYIWTTPNYTSEELEKLNLDVYSFLKMTSLEHRTLLDEGKWEMSIKFYIVDDPSN